MLCRMNIVQRAYRYRFYPDAEQREYPGPHVRLRPICVQLGFAAAHRGVLRTSATHWLRGNLQAAHGASAQYRTEAGPCSTVFIPQTERLKEPRQGQSQRRADSRQDCGSASGLAAPAHHKDGSRKPSDQRGETQDQEQGQKSLPVQIHSFCRWAWRFSLEPTSCDCTKKLRRDTLDVKPAEFESVSDGPIPKEHRTMKQEPGRRQPGIPVIQGGEDVNTTVPTTSSP